MSGIEIRALGAAVRIATSHARLVDDLRRVFRCFDVADTPHGMTPEADLRVEPGEGGAFTFARAGSPPLTTTEYPYLVASIAYDVYGRIRARANDHLLLHAGAVAWADDAVLLVGDKERGKSTLVAHLVKEGHDYLTDDMTPVRLDDGLVEAFPRAIDLRGDSPRLLAPTGDRITIYPYAAGEAAYPGRYALPSSDAVRRAPARPSVVVFSRWVKGATASLRPVGRAEAGGVLAQASANLQRLGERGFDAVTRLAASTRAFRLEYDALGDAGARVDEAFDSMRRG